MQPRRFSCTLCPYFTFFKSNLTKHIRKHTGERPYKCNICNRAFTQKFCLRTFNSGQDLVQHVEAHLFSCIECPYSTPFKSNLTKHVRIHTGERPYKCDVCSRTFIQTNSMKRHYANVHSKIIPGRLQKNHLSY